MKNKNNFKLKTVFYRNFFLLIVVPLLLVILIGLSILRSLMLKSANDQISLAQENVTNTLTTDVEAATLKLTHFLLTNSNQALELCTQIFNSTGQDKYNATTDLKELFNFIVTPNSDILGITFYNKNGQTEELKDSLPVSFDKIQLKPFYKSALENCDKTHVGSINLVSKTSSNKIGKMVLAVAFSPQKTQTSGAIEMVCLYMNTRANTTIRNYNKNEELGKMYLVDSQGNMLISPSEEGMLEIPSHIYDAQSGVYRYKVDGKNLNYNVSVVPGTNWRLVNVVDNSLLLHTFNRIVVIIILISILLFVLFFIYSYIFLQNIINPINSLVCGMAQVEQGDLNTHLEPIGQNELRTLTHSFNRMIRNTKELIKNGEQQQLEKYQSEMKALQSQINPHFLVNTLNSIRFIAMAAKYDSIKNMCEALIKILSASFKQSTSLYTINNEIEMLESYVYLMQIRYAENFEIKYKIDEICRNCKVPRLIMQPIVENAIVHGFENIDEIGHIKISVYQKDKSILLQVEDDGKGMDENQIAELLSDTASETTQHHGIGISNVNRRIKLNFGDEYGVSIISNGNSTVATLTIPFIVEEGDIKCIN